MKTHFYPSEVAVASLYLALPGCEVEPIGVLLLDPKTDQLYCKTNASTEDKDASEVLSFMPQDLVMMAEEHGGGVIFKYVQENLSNVLRVGDCEQMFVVDHPANAVDRIFSERVSSLAGRRHAKEMERLIPSRKILIVEDNPADVFLIKQALREYAPTTAVTVATDGEQALQFIESVGTNLTPPDLVLLDLNLPKVSGHEVLRSLRANPRLKSIRVAVLSSSTWTGDIEKAYQEGANCYVQKATDLASFNQSVSELCSLFFAAA
ncbi:MAG: response regulator [Bryobacteraceae bacterium]